MKKPKSLKVIARILGLSISFASKTNPRKVLLISNFGAGYSCNPKYIVEAMERLYPGRYKFILLTNEEIDDLPEYIERVKNNSFRSMVELATSGVWIDNCRTNRFVPKRSDQLYIQTWHSGLGLKRVEKDAENQLDPEYISRAKRDGKATDLMFANCNILANMFNNAFWYSGPVIRCGMPRNRPLVIPDGVAVQRVRDALGLGSSDDSVCLYAPTFRKDKSLAHNVIDLKRCKQALETRFDKPFTIVYRIHPNVAKESRPQFLKGFVDATWLPDSQELLSASDVVISDYSSILDDFHLTGRPGFMHATDIAEYLNEREFVFPIDIRPFPISQNEDELIENILYFDDEAFIDAGQKFDKYAGLLEDGMGDETIARIVNQIVYEHNSVNEAIACLGLMVQRRL